MPSDKDNLNALDQSTIAFYKQQGKGYLLPINDEVKPTLSGLSGLKKISQSIDISKLGDMGLHDSPQYSLDPDLMETTFQSDWANNWNTLRNAKDRIQGSSWTGKKADNEYFIDVIDDYLDGKYDSLYDEDKNDKFFKDNDIVSMGLHNDENPISKDADTQNKLLNLRKELEEDNAKFDENITKNKEEVKDSPVELDFTMFKDFLMQEENSNAWTAFTSGEFMEDLGGTVSVFGIQLAAIGGQIALRQLKTAALKAIPGAGQLSLAADVLSGAFMVAELAATSYAMYEARKWESYAELQEAREQKFKQIVDNEYNGIAPIDEEELRKIRMRTHKGLKDVYDNNQKLWMADTIETYLFGIGLPNLMGTTKLMSTLKNPWLRTAAQALKVPVTAYKEGVMEEANQFYWKHKYLNNEYSLHKEMYDNKNEFVEFFEDTAEVTKAWLRVDRPDLYENKEFRTAIKTGMLLGGLFGGVSSVASSMSDWMAYRGIKNRIQKDLGNTSDIDKMFNHKGSELYKIHSKGRDAELFRTLKTFGRNGSFNYTKETADTEIEEIKTLFKDFDEIIKEQSSLKRLIRKEAFIDAGARKSIFQDIYAISRKQKELSQLNSVISEKETEESFIGDLRKSIKEDLGASTNEEVQAKEVQDQIEKLKTNIKDNLTGKTSRDRATRKKLQKTDPKKAKTNTLKDTLVAKGKLQKESSLGRHFENFRENVELLDTVDKLYNPKLSEEEKIGVLGEVIANGNKLTDKGLYAPTWGKIKSLGGSLLASKIHKTEKAINDTSNEIRDTEAEFVIEEPTKEQIKRVNSLREDVLPKLLEEKAKLDVLSDNLLKLGSKSNEDFKAIREPKIESEAYYERMFADKKYISPAEAVIDKVNNNKEYDDVTSIEQQIGQLKELQEAYDGLVDYHEKSEFKTFKKDITDTIKKLEDKKKVAIKRQENNKLKELNNNKETLSANLLGLNIQIDGIMPEGFKDNQELEALYNELGSLKGDDNIGKSILVTEAMIDAIKANDELKQTNKTRVLKDKNKAIDNFFNYFTKLIDDFGEQGVNNFTSYLKNRYKISPRTSLGLLLQNHLQLQYFSFSGEVDPKSMGEFLRNLRNMTNASDMIQIINANEIFNTETKEKLIGLIKLHEKVLAFTDIEINLNSDYSFDKQRSVEKELLEGEEFGLSVHQQTVLRQLVKNILDNTQNNEITRLVTLLRGVAGTGKTIIMKWLITSLGLDAIKDIEYLSYNMLALNNLKEKVGLDKEGDLAADPIQDFIDNSVDFLDDKSIIIFDEAGWLSEPRFREVLDTLRIINSHRDAINIAPLKMVVVGDPTQLTDESVNQNFFNDAYTKDTVTVREVPSLSTRYRSNVSDINNVSDIFKNDVKKIDKFPATRVDSLSDPKYGAIVTNNDASFLDKLQTALKDKERSVTLIVNSSTEIQQYNVQFPKTEYPNLNILEYKNSQGPTFNDVFVDITRNGSLIDDEKYNRAMYVATSRTENFLVVKYTELKEDVETILDTELLKKSISKDKLIEQAKNDYQSALEYIDTILKNFKEDTTSEQDAEVEAKEVDEPVDEDQFESDDIREDLQSKVEKNKEETVSESLTPIDEVVDDENYKISHPQYHLRKLNLEAGDDITYVKTLFSNNELGITILKRIGDRKWRKVGVIGKDEMALRDKNPVLNQLYSAFDLVNNDFSDAEVNFIEDGKDRSIITNEDFNDAKTINGTMSYFNPLSFSYDGVSKDLVSDKKTINKLEKKLSKIIKATKETINGDIKVSHIILVNKLSQDSQLTDSDVATVYKRWPWVKAGIPYIKFSVPVKSINGKEGIREFLIIADPRKLDLQKDSEDVKSLGEFYSTIKRFQEIVSTLGLPMEYGSREDSGFTVTRKNGNVVNISKHELFTATLKNDLTNRTYSSSIDLYKTSQDLDNLIKTQLPEKLYSELISLGEKALTLFGRSTKIREDGYDILDSQEDLGDIVKELDRKDVVSYKTVEEVPSGIPKTRNINGVVFNVVLKNGKLEGRRVFETISKKDPNKSIRVTIATMLDDGLQPVKTPNEVDDLVSIYRIHSYTKDIVYGEQKFDNHKTIRYEDLESGFSGAINLKLLALTKMDELTTKYKAEEGTGKATADWNSLARGNAYLSTADNERKFIRVRKKDKTGKEKIYGKSLLTDTPTIYSHKLHFTGKELDETVEPVNLNTLDAIFNESIDSGLRKHIEMRTKQEADGQIHISYNPGDAEVAEVTITPTQIVVSVDEQKQQEQPIESEETKIIEEEDEFDAEDNPFFTKNEVNQLGDKKLRVNEATSLIKKLFPGIKEDNIRFLTAAEMFRLTSNPNVWGVFRKGVILLRQTKDGTVYENVLRHEAFHRVVHSFLTAKERSELFDTIYEINPSIKGNEKAADEWGATEFQKWIRGNSVSVKLKRLFNKILNYLNLLNNNWAKLDLLFSKIDNGYYKESEIEVTDPNIVRQSKLFDRVFNYNWADYNEAKNMYFKHLYNFMFPNVNKPVKQERTLRGDVKLKNIPLSAEEAFFMTERYFKAVLKNPSKFGVNDRGMEILKLLSDKSVSQEFFGEIAGSSKVMSLSNAERESITEGNMVSIYADVVDQSQIDWENKLSQNIALRDLFNRAYFKNAEGKFDGAADSKVLFVVLNKLFNQIDPSLVTEDDFTKFKNQLRHFKIDIGERNKYTTTLFSLINTLIDQKDSTTYKKRTKVIKNGKPVNKLTSLPGFMGFRYDKDFIISKDENDKVAERTIESDEVTIERGRLNTESFFRRIYRALVEYDKINNTNYADYNMIRALYLKENARNTMQELISFGTSMRKKNPYFGYESTSYENGEEITRQSFGRSIALNSSTAIPKRIQDALADIIIEVKGKKVTQLQLLKSSYTENQNEELDFMVSFFKILDINTVKSNLTIEAGTESLIVKDMISIIKEIDSISKIKNQDTANDAINSYLKISETTKSNINIVLANLANVITGISQDTKALSVKDAEGNTRYLIHTNSEALNSIQRFINNVTNKNLFRIPVYLKSKLFQMNPFVSGKSRLIKITDWHEKVEEDYIKKSIRPSDEKTKGFLSREFALGFLKALSNASYDLSYIQFDHRVSDKPDVYGYRVGLLNENDIKNNLRIIVRQDLEKKGIGADFKKLNIEVDGFDFDNYSFGNKNKIKSSDNIDTLVDELYNSILKDSKTLYNNSKETKLLPFTSEIVAITDKLSQKDKSTKQVIKKSSTFLGETNEETLFNLYSLNNYVNGYFINQLTEGHVAFLGKPNNQVKRASLFYAMGKRPTVGKDGMTRVKTKIGVMKDFTDMKTKFTDWRGLFSKSLNMFYDTTDAEVYATEKWFNDFRRGMGIHDMVGPILKPIIAYKDEHGIPRTIKMSLIVLDKNTINGNPELQKLKEDMDAKSYDLLAHRSSIKTGIPKNLHNYGEKITKEGDDFSFNVDSTEIRIQLNPYSDSNEKTVPLFSQLTYLLNTNNNSKVESNAVFKALADILKLSKIEYQKRIMRNGKVNRKAVRKLLIDAFNATPNNEQLAAMFDSRLSAENKVQLLNWLNKGKKLTDIEIESIIKDNNFTGGHVIDLNMPDIIKRTISQIFSSFNKNVTQIKFPGNKYILQESSRMKVYKIANTIKTFDQLDSIERQMVQRFYDKFSSQAAQRAMTELYDANDNNKLEEYLKVLKFDKAFKDELKTEVGDNYDKLIENAWFANLTDKERIDISEIVANINDDTNYIVPRKLSMKGTTNNTYTEVVIPESMAKQLVKRFNLFSLDDLQDILIGVRIPSTGINSALIMKVVGTTNGNRIFAPEEIVLLHGSDFDADSIFAMNKEYISKNDQILSLYESISLKLGAEDKKLLDTNIRVGYPIGYNEDGTFNEDFEIQLSEIKKIVQRDIINPRLLQKFNSLYNQLLIKYNKNVYFENTSKILLKDENKEDVFSPISFEIFKSEVIPYLEKIYGKKILDTDFDINMISNKLKTHLDSFSGSKLISIIANVVKLFSYIKSADVATFEKEYLAGKEFTLDGNIYNKFSDVERHTENPHNLWKTFDSMLNAAVDNIKEQILFTLNMTNDTINPFSILLSMGVPIKKIALFMNQPIIREDGDLKLNTLERYLSISNKDFIDGEWKNYLTTKHLENALKEKNFKNRVLTKKLTAVEDMELLKTQYAVRRYFEEYKVIGKKLRNLSSSISLLKEMPTTEYELTEKLNTLKENSWLLKNNYIQSIYNIGKWINESVIKSLFYIYDPKEALGEQEGSLVSTVINNTGIELSRNKEENKFLLRMELQKYILSNFMERMKTTLVTKGEYSLRNATERSVSYRKRVRKLTPDEAWQESFIDELKRYTIETKNENKFLKKFTIKKDRFGRRYLEFNTRTGMSPLEIQEVIADFILLNDDKSLSSKEKQIYFTEFQQGFLKYSLLSDGLAFRLHGFTQFMPPNLKYAASDFLSSKGREMMQNGFLWNRYFQHFAVSIALKFPDKIPTARQLGIKWDKQAKKYSLIEKKGTVAPLIMRAGDSNKGYSIFIRTSSLLTKADKVTVTYEKLGMADARMPYNLTNNIFKYGWSVKDFISRKYKTANTGIGNIPAPGERNIFLQEATEGVFAVKETNRLTEGEVVWIKTKNDPLGVSAVRYIVDVIDDIKVDEIIGNKKKSVKGIRYSLEINDDRFNNKNRSNNKVSEIKEITSRYSGSDAYDKIMNLALSNPEVFDIGEHKNLNQEEIDDMYGDWIEKMTNPSDLALQYIMSKEKDKDFDTTDIDVMKSIYLTFKSGVRFTKDELRTAFGLSGEDIAASYRAFGKKGHYKVSDQIAESATEIYSSGTSQTDESVGEVTVEDVHKFVIDYPNGWASYKESMDELTLANYISKQFKKVVGVNLTEELALAIDRKTDSTKITDEDVQGEISTEEIPFLEKRKFLSKNNEEAYDSKEYLPNKESRSRSLLMNLAKNADKQQHRILAKLLLKIKAPSVFIKMMDAESYIKRAGNKKSISFYDEDNNVILVRDDIIDKTTFEEIILHEYIHHLTVKGLRINKAFASRMNTLYNYAKLNGSEDLMTSYGIKDIREFIAEAFANEEFQSELLKIESPNNTNRTLWREFLDVLRRYISSLIPNIQLNQRSLLEDVISSTVEYLEGPKYKEDFQKETMALKINHRFKETFPLNSILSGKAFEKYLYDNNNLFAYRLLKLLRRNHHLPFDISFQSLPDKIYGLYSTHKGIIIDIDKHIEDPENLKLNVTETIIHEIIHSEFIYNLYSVSNQNTKEYKELENIYKYAKKIYNGENKIAFQNIDEFVSEIFSNKKFQQELYNIKYKSSNSLDSFVNIILKFLGIIERDNLLAEGIVKILKFQNLYTNLEENLSYYSDNLVHRMESSEVDELASKGKKYKIADDEEHYINKNSPAVGKLKRVSTVLSESFSPIEKESFTNKVDGYFKGLDKTIDKITLDINGTRKELNYKEAVDILEQQSLTNRNKGKIKHKIMEGVDRGSTEIIKLAKEPKLNINIKQTIKWLTPEKVVKIFNLFNINIYNPTLAKFIGIDKVQREVTVAIEELGIAGTIDLLAEHAKLGTNDKTRMTLIDWKFYENLTSHIISNRRMNHSKGTIYSSLNKAKLQVALLTFMVKYNFPETTFAGIYLGDLKEGLAENQMKIPVNMGEFLPIIKSWVMKTNPDFYYANKNLFNEKEYGGINQDLYLDFRLNKEQGVTELMDKLSKEALDLSIAIKFKRGIPDLKVTKEVYDLQKNTPLEELEKRLITVSEKIIQLEAGTTKDVSKFHEKSLLGMWAGHWYNTRDPRLKQFVSIINRAKVWARKKRQSLKYEHDSLMEPILDEYYAKHKIKGIFNKVTLGGINFLSYKGLFDFMWEEKIDGYKKIITKNSPGYENLTSAQKIYHTFVVRTMRNELFKTMHPKELIPYLEADLKVAKVQGDVAKIESIEQEIKDVRAQSNYDINKFIEVNLDGFKWTEDFTPIVPRVFSEAVEHLSLVKGKTGGSLKDLWSSSWEGVMDRAAESAEELNNEVYGVPVKYITSNQGIQTATHNVDIMLQAFLNNMIGKRTLDEPYAIGHGLSLLYEANSGKKGNPKLTNSIKWLNNGLMIGYIRNKRVHSKFFNNKIFIPGTNYEINPEYAARAILALGRLAILAWRVISPLANGIMEILRNEKEGIAGSIASLLGKADDGSIAYTAMDLKKAKPIYFKFLFDTMSGNKHNNKIWNLLQQNQITADMHDDYLPSHRLKSGKNKLLSQSSAYMGYSIFDNYATANVFIAQMIHKKHNGKSMLSNYNNQGEWTGGLRGYEKESNKPIYGLHENEVRRMKVMNERVRGGYGEDEKTMASLNITGASMLMFKKYIPSAIHKTWSSKYDSDALGRFILAGGELEGPEGLAPIFEWESQLIEGEAQTALKSVPSMVFQMLHFLRIVNASWMLTHKPEYQWKNLSGEQRKGVVNVYLSLIMYGSIIAVMKAAFEDKDPPDWMPEGIYAKFKRRFEIMPSDILYGLNARDIFRAFETPTVVASRIVKVSDGLSAFVVDGMFYGETTDDGKIPGLEGLFSWTPGFGLYKELGN